jgi:Leucine-rich repeat (LRR) protein
VRFMILFAILLAPGTQAVFAADLRDSDLANWLNSLKGSATTDSASVVTGINLRGTWATDVDLDRLARLQTLTTLDLSLTDISDAGMERLKALPQVTDLNLAYAELITDSGVAYLKAWKNLEHLNLRGTKVNDTGLEHLKNLTQLKSLDVSFTEVTDAGLDHLTSLGELRKLCIGGNKMSGAGLHSLKLLPCLKNLDLSGSQRTDSGIWSISVTDLNLESVASLTGLQELNLGGAKVTSLGLKTLSSLGQLRSLDLNSTQVSNTGLAILSSLPNLESLSLWRCKGVGDGVLPHLLVAKRLAVLDLAETKLTDKGLVQLQKMTALRLLYLGGTAVTQSGIEQFKRAKPQCRIVWGERSYYENTKAPPVPDED